MACSEFCLKMNLKWTSVLIRLGPHIFLIGGAWIWGLVFMLGMDLDSGPLIITGSRLERR